MILTSPPRNNWDLASRLQTGVPYAESPVHSALLLHSWAASSA
jgi:hypothetical protein